MRHATFRTASHLLLGALLFSAAGISTAEAGQRRGQPPAPMGPPPGDGDGQRPRQPGRHAARQRRRVWHDGADDGGHLARHGDLAHLLV